MTEHFEARQIAQLLRTRSRCLGGAPLVPQFLKLKNTVSSLKRLADSSLEDPDAEIETTPPPLSLTWMAKSEREHHTNG
jgi:hypothetical protein